MRDEVGQAGADEDRERYPTLSAAGRELLRWMREHPRAPIYRNRSGNRLLPEDLAALTRLAERLAREPVGWEPGAAPAWLPGFVARSLAAVPHYRAYGAPPARLADLPTIDRGDLSCDIAAFVPDDLPLERLINFRTSGTTGHPLLIASHPAVAASYQVFHRAALAAAGVQLRAGPGRVGVVLVGLQRRCFTYLSVTPAMGESGLAKINLHPDDWHHPDDRARYLDALAPEVYTGDPLSLAALAELPLATRPAALLSTSMTLCAGLRQRLEERFGCVVLDLYSLNEAGPVACAGRAGQGHALLQPMLYVEILDPAGRPLPPGERGEVTLTGGFNPYLPLVRYRTGDWASLRWDGRRPVLQDLQGRPPVRFVSRGGEWLNNIEVTHALQGLPLAQWTLHQRQDRSLLCRYVPAGAGCAALVQAALLGLFGPGQALELQEVAGQDLHAGPLAAGAVRDGAPKPVQYSSDLDQAGP